MITIPYRLQEDGKQGKRSPTRFHSLATSISQTSYSGSESGETQLSMVFLITNYDSPSTHPKFESKTITRKL